MAFFFVLKFKSDTGSSHLPHHNSLNHDFRIGFAEPGGILFGVIEFLDEQFFNHFWEVYFVGLVKFLDYGLRSRFLEPNGGFERWWWLGFEPNPDYLLNVIIWHFAPNPKPRTWPNVVRVTPLLRSIKMMNDFLFFSWIA